MQVKIDYKRVMNVVALLLALYIGYENLSVSGKLSTLLMNCSVTWRMLNGMVLQMLKYAVNIAKSCESLNIL